MARLACVVQPTPAGVSVTWSDGPAAFAPYELPARPLAAAADAARAALGAVVEGSFTDDGGDGPAAAAALAAAGYGLYQALFKPPAEQMALASEVRKWLDALQAEGAVEGLEVVAEGGPAVPWNLVYDRRPDPAAFKAAGDDPARWRPFWGLRYDLAGGRRVSPLRRLPVLHNPRVVVVTDPLVIDRLPTEARELAALCQEHGWGQARTRPELADALQAGRPDLLYWLGHTQTDPFGLVLGDDVITPDDLKTMLEGDPFADAGSVFGGVAFLNACGTAVAEKSGSFLDALHPLGLTGYVATEQVTVDTFAAPLGREFLTAFAVRGEPLGKVMRDLRGRVPLGLLYGSYCPSAVHVRHDARTQPTDAAPIVLTHAAVGTKLGRDPTRPQTDAHPLPPQPYRSLQAYGPADRALFAGRDADTLRFAQLLDEPGTRLVILHGESGVGKTSFIRAGVVPFLEHECVGYRFARDRSRDDDKVLLVRATNDPVAQIAAALTTFCAAPLAYRTPAGAEASADLPGVLRAAVGDRTGRDALRDALRADPALLGRLLADLGRVLPFTPVLVLDQAEEVFTLARTPDDEANRAQALEMLRRAAAGPAGFKVVVSLRTEYHGRLTDKLRKGAGPAGGVRDYLLTDFGHDALTEVIRRPTSREPIEYAVEIPAEKYGFRFADGVAEDIARRTRAYSINRADSVLPLVQVVCSQLYDRVSGRADKVVGAADLEAIGGVEGGMRAHAEALVAQLFPRGADRRAFKRLLADPRTQLFIRQADGTLTTALLPAAFLARHWAGPTPFEDVLRIAGAGDRRLVRVNSLRIGGDEEEQRYVSLGHDALAKVAARWQEERRRRAQMRTFTAAVAVLFAVASGLAALAGYARSQRDEARIQRDEAVTARAAAAAAEAQRIEADEKAKEKELETRVNGLVNALTKAETAEVQRLLDELGGEHERARPRLLEVAAERTDSRPGLHARLALVYHDGPHRVDRDWLSALIDYVPRCRPEETLPIRHVLRRDPASGEQLWGELEKRQAPAERVRVAAVLAGLAPADARWAGLAGRIVTDVVQATPAESVVWVEAFAPVLDPLCQELAELYRTTQDTIATGRVPLEHLHDQSVRLDRAAELLATSVAGRPGDIAELLATVDPRHHTLFVRAAAPRPDRPDCRREVVARLRTILAHPDVGRPLPEDERDYSTARHAKRKARAAAAVLGLGDAADAAAVWPMYVHTPDPTARSWLVHRTAGVGVDPAVLAARLRVEPDPSARRALILAIGEYPEARIAPLRDELAADFLRRYRDDPDAGMHAAIDWVLRVKWQMKEELAAVTAGFKKAAGNAGPAGPDLGWFVNHKGQTFTIIRGPKSFTMGTQPEEPVREPSLVRPHEKVIGRSYAIAAREVTVQEFEEFRPGYRDTLGLDRRDIGPAEQVSWYEAAAYCNWLSHKAGIDESQWCYEPLSAAEAERRRLLGKTEVPGRQSKGYEAGMKIRPNHLKLTGYRLPTEAEWEYAARAGSAVGRYFGRADGLLPAYAWGRQNARERLEEVGFLKPNDFGLFDVLGGALEWVVNEGGDAEAYPLNKREDGAQSLPQVVNNEPRGLRGGSLEGFPSTLRSSYRYRAPADARLSSSGFRPARTLPQPPQ